VFSSCRNWARSGAEKYAILLHDDPAHASERDALRRELARLVADALGL
jgi:hypothetical protein